MSWNNKILPGTGRGTARVASGGGGPPHLHRLWRTPSTKPLRVLVPLPVNGEDL
jgi:hypothetical protein